MNCLQKKSQKESNGPRVLTSAMAIALMEEKERKKKEEAEAKEQRKREKRKEDTKGRGKEKKGYWTTEKAGRVKDKGRRERGD